MEKVFKNKKTGEIAYYKDGILKVNNCAVEIGHEPSLEFWGLVERGEVIGKDFYGNDILKYSKIYSVSDDLNLYFTDMATKENIKGVRCFVSKDLAKRYKKEREEIVLTTNDEVSLKFGDKYFVASPESYQIFEASAGITFKTERWEGCGFSTRELAEEWILMNRPLLSLEDLLSVWGCSDDIEFYRKSSLFSNFKKLAEKKL